MPGFVLKVKTKNGQHIVNDLTTISTVSDLKKQLAALAQISEDRLHIRSGFPPKSVDLHQPFQSLADVGIQSGDILILEELPCTENVANFVANADNNTSETPSPSTTSERSSGDCPGILMKHVVPADNSCLFTSINFVLNGKVDETGTVAPWMRSLIAETVGKDPETYSEAMLGKSNNDYCKWIRDDKSWGGAIEISILSKYYGIEIAVVDTMNAIINRFGEDQDYGQRVFLLFDGIHYDPLFLEPIGGGNIQTLFPKEDERILREAEQLAAEAKASRQFTDVNKFMLKCMVCNIQMSGQVQAQNHAKETGHQNFGEV